MVLGNGGDNCISMIAAAFVEPGDEVIVSDPSFRYMPSPAAPPARR